MLVYDKLIKLFTHLFNCGYQSGHHDTVEGCYTDILESDIDTYQSDVVESLVKELGLRRKPMCDYDSDFNNAKSGDWAYGRHGWKKIKMENFGDYPVNYDGISHTEWGYSLKADAYPSIFLKPPACFMLRPSRAPSRKATGCWFEIMMRWSQ